MTLNDRTINKKIKQLYEEISQVIEANQVSDLNDFAQQGELSNARDCLEEALESGQNKMNGGRIPISRREKEVKRNDF